MNKAPKVSKKEEKTIDLYQFYLRYGFNLTIDKISHLLGIGRKTFYNRYQSREASINLALKHSHQRFVERFQEKLPYCNHSVEELVLFISAFLQYAQSDKFYFEYDRDHQLFISENAPFKSILENIIKKGRRSYHINEELNLDIYLPYFFFNLSNYENFAQQKPVLTRFILMPLLNERGLELLGELELDAFM